MAHAQGQTDRKNIGHSGGLPEHSHRRVCRLRRRVSYNPVCLGNVTHVPVAIPAVLRTYVGHAKQRNGRHKVQYGSCRYVDAHSRLRRPPSTVPHATGRNASRVLARLVSRSAARGVGDRASLKCLEPGAASPPASVGTVLAPLLVARAGSREP